MSSIKRKALCLKDVTLMVANRHLLGPLNLTIDEGEITTVMGPSGSGKSALLILFVEH